MPGENNHDYSESTVSATTLFPPLSELLLSPPSTVLTPLLCLVESRSLCSMSSSVENVVGS